MRARAHARTRHRRGIIPVRLRRQTDNDRTTNHKPMDESQPNGLQSSSLLAPGGREAVQGRPYGRLPVTEIVIMAALPCCLLLRRQKWSRRK